MTNMKHTSELGKMSAYLNDEVHERRRQRKAEGNCISREVESRMTPPTRNFPVPIILLTRDMQIGDNFGIIEYYY